MAKKKRKTPGINGSSSADIAFMLLIFFLITTSMDTDKGLARRLPPWPKEQDPKQQPVEVNDRNVMRLLVNRADELVISKRTEVIPIRIDQLKQRVVDFLLNRNEDPNLPDREVREIKVSDNAGNELVLGNRKVVTSGYAISLKSEITTTYQTFISVQNEILAAYNEVWNTVAKAEFGKPFDSLTELQQKAVREMYPMHLSEMPLSNLQKK